jgi:Ni,Fe-hydrogenase III small subunit
MLETILKALRAGVVTTRYPDEPAEAPPGFRGAPRFRPGARFADLPPPAVCPSGAISAAGDVAGDGYAIDVARCIFCGRCGMAGDGPIEIGRDFELAARRRDALRVTVAGDADGRIVPADVPDTADAAELTRQVATRIRRTLGRSLHLRHLDAGSCNACDWELTALLNPFYDVRRLGIDFVASPRHADGVIVTGPVTRNLAPAVLRTFEAVPEPRLVIAVGACASSGGIVGRGYASAGGVAEVLPVDVFIPGCPPRPEAILFGILCALGRLEPRR